MQWDKVKMHTNILHAEGTSSAAPVNALDAFLWRLAVQPETIRNGYKKLNFKVKTVLALFSCQTLVASMGISRCTIKSTMCQLYAVTEFRCRATTTSRARAEYTARKPTPTRIRTGDLIVANTNVQTNRPPADVSVFAIDRGYKKRVASSALRGSAACLHLAARP
ncbi:unnamed protein product, partial [Dicrocoelium dendriticum]